MNKLTLFISALLLVILNVSQAWALPNCVGSWSTSTWNNCVGTYNWDNGDKYVGEHKNGMAHGQGTRTFGLKSEWAGDKYVGEYKDDKRNGQGTYTYANGNKYVGEFRDDKFNGRGIKTYVNGTVEDGIWKDWEFQYAQKKSKLDKHKDTCKEIGFTPKTESFGNCVLKLMDKD